MIRLALATCVLMLHIALPLVGIAILISDPTLPRLAVGFWCSTLTMMVIGFPQAAKNFAYEDTRYKAKFGRGSDGR